MQARRNWPVTEGDRLSVERGSRTSVQIGSATLRLDGGSFPFSLLYRDGSRNRRRGAGNARAADPDLNPDGTKIVYTVQTPDGRVVAVVPSGIVSDVPCA